MELGVMKLRCQGLNILQGAIHDENGLAWTDGRGIYLSPVSLSQGHLHQQEHNKLGEFERGVLSIHWSHSITEGLCYMCVVHERNISVWKVEGHQPKLAFKQVRKVNIQPISQGCIWNPGRDLLCVLCPQQASIYYSHVQNKGSQVLLQLERDKIRCGCWLSDGARLVICIETTLMVYHWSDIDQSVSQYTNILWTAPGLGGRISAVIPVSLNTIVYAAELSLETLVKNQDSFVLPDLLNTYPNPTINDELTESVVIKPKKNGKSLTEALFNLPRNPETVLEDCCRLDCVEFADDRDPVIVCATNIPGILTPDILLYESPNTVVVGSNTQTWLQVFSLTNTSFTKQREICLSRDERPKGIACLPKCAGLGEPGILLLIGKKDGSDAAFPTPTNTVTMKSVLKFFSLKSGQYGKTPLTHTQSAPSLPLPVATSGRDFELLTHSVINFDTTLRHSVHDGNEKDYTFVAIDKAKGSLNDHSCDYPNDSTRNSGEAVQNLSNLELSANDFKNPSDVCKDIVSAIKNIEEDTKVRSETDSDAPVAPKRPVRKKKSLRNQKEQLSIKSSLSSEERQENTSTQTATVSSGGGHGAKMAMEYLSDSPDMSPRESHAGKVIAAEPHSVKNTQPGSAEIETRTISETDEFPNVKPKDSSDVKSANSNEYSERLCPKNETKHQNFNLNINSKEGTGSIIVIGGSNNTKLEIERTDFSAQERNFQPITFCEEEEKVHDVLKRKLHLKEAEFVLKPSHSLESLDDIDRILKEQNKKISQLQEQMSKLSRRIDESSCVLPTRYQTVSTLDLVHLCFRRKDGVEMKKTFLLDNGRLQLNQIKQAFCLDTVELLVDGEPCVTGCNIDGYIPVRFEPLTTVYISGKPARS